MQLEIEGFDHLVIEVASSLDREQVEELWTLYDSAFKRIAHHNPCRQHLHRDEFDSALRHSDYTTLIGYDERATVFFCLLTDDFGLVPWVAPEFYDNEFPEAAGKRVHVCYFRTTSSPGRDLADTLLPCGQTTRGLAAVGDLGSLDVDLRQPFEPAGEVPVPVTQQLHARRHQYHADDRGVEDDGDGEP